MEGETRVGYMALDAMKNIYTNKFRKMHEGGLELDSDLMSRINNLDILINYDVNVMGDRR
jgi:hypothetical protein